METALEKIYMPDDKFVAYIQNLNKEGKARLIALNGIMTWVVEENGVEKIVIPENGREKGE